MKYQYRFEVLWSENNTVKQASFKSLEDARSFADTKREFRPQVWERYRGKLRTAMHYGKEARS